MGKHKDLSNFDKDQIVMARRLGQSISKTSVVVGCSWSAVVRMYLKVFQGGKKLATGSLLHMENKGFPVNPYRRAQIAEKGNAGSDKKVLEHNAFQFMSMGLSS